MHHAQNKRQHTSKPMPGDVAVHSKHPLGETGKDTESFDSVTKRNVYALIGLCLGVTSVVLYRILIVPVLGIIFSTIGLVRAKKCGRKGKVQAMIGLALGIFFTSPFLATMIAIFLSHSEAKDLSLLLSRAERGQVTKRTGDQGADLFAERFGKKVVIQAKNYYDSVGNSAIQQVLSAKLFYGCDEALVITNSYFTPSAKELAEATGVRLVDRTQLQLYLDEYNQTVAGGTLLASDERQFR